MATDLITSQHFTFDQALVRTDSDFVWRAELRDGTVIFEQPGLSSDSLPRDEVTKMEYWPTKTRQDFPVIECQVDISKGERFVRYWSTVWKNGGGTQRLYVLGLERETKFALMAFYPLFNKVTFASTKPFQPLWHPKPFDSIPDDAIVKGGPGTAAVGWTHDSFGGIVVRYPKRLVFTALYH